MLGELQGKKLHEVLQFAWLELQLLLQQLLQDLSVAWSGLELAFALQFEDLVLCDDFRRKVCVFDSVVAKLLLNIPVVLELSVELVKFHLLLVGMSQ